MSTISLLNDLIEVCKDGEFDFNRAVRDTGDTGLKHFFLDRAQRSAANAAELQEQVRALGSTPETQGSMIGALRRRWMDVRGVVPRSDDAILEQCERREAEAKSGYADALDVFMPDEIQKIVQRQYKGVVANLDRVRQLRNLRKAQARVSYISHA